MRIRWLTFALVATMLAGTSCTAAYVERSTAHAPVPASRASLRLSYFYDSLDPWGHWVQIAPYGWCWSPSGVVADWSPYVDGTWVYTDYGWTWASYEPWGWATCHYGRWFYGEDYGWLWVPGTIWAPAWVAWHCNDEWFGWAPLPPEADWDVHVGLRFASAERIPPRHWCFVPAKDIGTGSVRQHLAPVSRNVTLFERTRDVTRFETRDGRPFNRGVDPDRLERSAERPIPRLKIADVDSPSGTRSRAAGEILRVFRPTLKEARPAEAPRRLLEARESALPPAERERRREQERRRLEIDLAREQARLAREQRSDVRRSTPGAPPPDVNRRNAEEQRELREHAAERLHVFEHRWRTSIGRFKPAGDSGGRPPVSGKTRRPGRHR